MSIMIDTPRGPVDHVDILVVGAGFGGIAMADRLLREGRGGDILVVEAGDEVGGTWRDNTYPGCACDVPTSLYSLSGHAHPDWSHSFGRQGEIHFQPQLAPPGRSNVMRVAQGGEPRWAVAQRRCSHFVVALKDPKLVPFSCFFIAFLSLLFLSFPFFLFALFPCFFIAFLSLLFLSFLFFLFALFPYFFIAFLSS